MNIQKVNLYQNKNLNFQGRVNERTIKSFIEAKDVLASKKSFWESCHPDKGSILFIKSYETTSNKLSTFLNEIKNKMLYFAKDCELYITEKNAFIKHPKSDFVQVVSEYKKFDISKFIKDFEKIDPLLSNSHFCSQRYEKVSRRLFAPEVSKFSSVTNICPDKIAEDTFILLDK